MSTLFTSLSASDAQELRGGLGDIVIVGPIPPTNPGGIDTSDPANLGTGLRSNKDGLRAPATEAGKSGAVISNADVPGNNYGWTGISG